MHSLVMTVRTVVMLACMIALPLAAVFWPTISEQMRVWLADLQSRPRAESSREPSAAPEVHAPANADPMAAVAAPPAIDAPPAFETPAAATALGTNPAAEFDGALPQPASPASRPRQPVRNMSEWSKQSSHAPAPIVDGTAAGSSPALAGPLVPMSATSDDLSASRVRQAGGAVVEPTAPSDVGSSALPRAEHAEIHAGLGRLRELGANYYRLETDGRQYHFCCDVAVSPDSNREKRFTAAAVAPQQAVALVVAEIEAWRGSGSR